jgi:hypothetical protein
LKLCRDGRVERGNGFCGPEGGFGGNGGGALNYQLKASPRIPVRLGREGRFENARGAREIPGGNATLHQWLDEIRILSIDVLEDQVHIAATRRYLEQASSSRPAGHEGVALP